MIILRLLLLLTNLHLKLLSTQGTGADKLLSTQRVKYKHYQISSGARASLPSIIKTYCHIDACLRQGQNPQI